MNSFGTRLRVTIFGSSHGPSVGATVEGIPKGRSLDLGRIQEALDRRRSMGRRLATKRQEADRLVVDAGIQEGRTDGTPFQAHVDNEDVRRAPYDRIRNTPRPGHADYPARVRYGPEADLSGGGIFSGRMTVGLVLAGAIGQQLLEPLGVRVAGFTTAIGGVEAPADESMGYEEIVRRRGESEVGSLDPASAKRMEAAIASARQDGDSVGGIVEARAFGVPVGLGEPFFDSIESVVAHLAFSIPAVKGVEFGAGFRAATMKGSEHNDAYEWRDGGVALRTNRAGGILGGLADGAPIVVRAVVKPTASIAKPQDSVHLELHRSVALRVTGRHDPCIVPRAIVVLESVLAFALADLALQGGFLR